jgi:hypothetical protein
VTTRLKDEFFLKLMAARLTGVVDAAELIDRQRRECLQALRDLNVLAARTNGDGAAELMAEGAALHLEADLKWLDRYEERVRGGSNGPATD